MPVLGARKETLVGPSGLAAIEGQVQDPLRVLPKSAYTRAYIVAFRNDNVSRR